VAERRIDVEEVMRRIRAGLDEVDDAESRGAAGLPGSRPEPEIFRPELARLNRAWQIDAAGEIRSHRRVVGPLIVALKRRFQRLVLSILEPYLDRERAFLADLVRVLNRLVAAADRKAEREELADLVASVRAGLDDLAEGVAREGDGARRP
jgi:hypothetical protein